MDVRPAWSALLADELGVHLSRDEIAHLPRLSVAAGIAGASHPCCGYVVMRRDGLRAMAKLQALLLLRVYLQEAHEPAGLAAGPAEPSRDVTRGPEGRCTGASRPPRNQRLGARHEGLSANRTHATVAEATVSASASETELRMRGAASTNRASRPHDAPPTDQPWWAERAFAFAKPNWAAFDGRRGCFEFEGRAPNRIETHKWKVPRYVSARHESIALPTCTYYDMCTLHVHVCMYCDM